MTHYYSKKQTSQLNEQQVTVRLLGYEFKFNTASGLFSKDHLDNATKLLIETASKELSESQKPNQQITAVDLGCGWGVVGIILKRLHQNINFVAVDINERAIDYTTKNAKKNKAQIEVLQSNILEAIKEPVDIILTNPPYAAGRDICFQFIEQSKNQLVDNGQLYLVARHQKGGKMLEKKMEETFGNVQTLAKSGGFRVYISRKLIDQ